MDAHERAVETVTEPVAPLGVHHPVPKVLLVTAVPKLPGVQSVERLQRVLLADSYLHADVGGGGSIVEQIGFQRDLLGTGTLGANGKGDSNRHQEL